MRYRRWSRAEIRPRFRPCRTLWLHPAPLDSHGGDGQNSRRAPTFRSSWPLGLRRRRHRQMVALAAIRAARAMDARPAPQARQHKVGKLRAHQARPQGIARYRARKDEETLRRLPIHRPQASITKERQDGGRLCLVSSGEPSPAWSVDPR